MGKQKWLSLGLVLIMLATLLAGCGNGASTVTGSTPDSEPTAAGGSSGEATGGDTYKIGLSMPTAQEPVWVAQGEYLAAECEKRGYEYVMQVADGDADKQYSQIENMIAQGVDAIIIGPYDNASLGPVVQQAHDQGIKVISTIRVLENCDVDGLICWDQYNMGEQQAAGFLASKFYAEAEKPANVVVLNGDLANKADIMLVRQGVFDGLQKEIDAGNINIVMDEFVEDYLPANALAYVENALTITNNKIAAILCVNDGTALGSIQALQNVGLEGQVYVAGHDAELSAIHAILNETLHISLWQNEQIIAKNSLDAVEALLSGSDFPWNDSKDNGKFEVPTLMTESIGITIENVDLTMQAGYYTEEEVYGR